MATPAPLTGTFAATGQSSAAKVVSASEQRDVSISLYGTFVATVQPERSFDNGVNWLPLSYIDGSAIAWTAPLTTSIGDQSHLAQVRLNCTSYTSGTVNWRID